MFVCVAPFLGAPLFVVPGGLAAEPAKTDARYVAVETIAPRDGNVILVPNDSASLWNAVIRLELPGGAVSTLLVQGEYVSPDRDYSMILDGEPDGTPASSIPDSIPPEKRDDPELVKRLPTALESDAVVRLVYPGGADTQEVCSAVAITESWLLTAAHCVRHRPVSLLLGKEIGATPGVDLSSDLDACKLPRAFAGPDVGDEGPSCWEVDAELLRDPSIDQDLALIRVAGALPSGTRRPFAGAVPTPPKSWADGVRVVGYGATALADSSGGCTTVTAFATERQAGEFSVSDAPGAALVLTGTPRAASGDSGAPVLARITGPWQREVVVGIVTDSDCSGTQRASSIMRSDVSAWLIAVTGAKPI